MKKKQKELAAEDLLGAAAFSLSHFLEEGLTLKEAARRLWQEHERHARSVGLPSQLIMLLRDGVIECSTAACQNIFGAEICGQAFLQRITALSGDAMAQRAKDKADGKIPARKLKLDFVRHDGGTFSADMSVAEIYSEKGAFALALLSLHNDTVLAGGGR
ncbi:MAG TPA: hypothetical protein PLL10_09210 [Elusimicrobiales bacterium]|nr:hypothetical protein [Elusimicrobiales bacterium]